MAASISWIKITTNIFDDEKILLIESLPEADSIIVIWFKLLTLAGKCNNNGILMLNDSIPYTEEMLATIFRRPLNTVRLALETFEKFGMIVTLHDTITIPNWEKHQQVESLDKIREKTNKRVRAYRERQKMLLEGNSTNSSDVTLYETECNVSVTQENKREIENKNNKFKYICPESKELCELLINYCKRDNPNFSKTVDQINKWTNAIGAIHFLDNYTWEDIKKVIDFAKNDGFWNSNILSGDKLRKQMEQLYVKAKGKNQQQYQLKKNLNPNLNNPANQL
ncbi:MAG: phage replisome organizer N-terminal domain-containing protein [Methanobrevibacter sp.]|nr:phage replisome organizer N-terminal domain-containing protein [Methanobrevibacter sp.]MBP5785276.1 phage replisome organizer N-terminal domain-containing protein [Methanobrevibacter sp.]